MARTQAFRRDKWDRVNNANYHNQRATVLKFNGSDWEVVGTDGFTPDGALNLQLAVAPSGQPLLAFHDRVDESTWRVGACTGLGSIWRPPPALDHSKGCILVG